MGKASTNISFDKDFLSKLRNDHNACVYVNTIIYHLALHPFHLTDLNTSVKGLLNEKIAKYDKRFGGILLGYENIKLLDSVGGVNYDSCFMHGNIQADFYVFNPTVGQVLNGIVNKKSKDHVGCLVHATFNVSLPKAEDSESWLGNSAQIGQEVRFEIIFTDLDGKLPYIKGKILSLVSDDSGFSTSEEPCIKNSQQSQVNDETKLEDGSTEIINNSKKKRKRKREDEDPYNETNTEIGECSSKKQKREKNIVPDILNDDIKIRKSKKKKVHKEHDCSIDQNEEPCLEINKKIKKKRNKENMVSELIGESLVTPKSKKKKHKL